MAVPFLKRFLPGTTTYNFKSLLSDRHEALRKLLQFKILARTQSQPPLKFEDDAVKPSEAAESFPGDNPQSEDNANNKWELNWVNKAVEPALKLCKWALPSVGSDAMPSNWSVSDMISLIKKSKLVIEGWNLSEMTIGLYLIYLRQASLRRFEDIKAERVSSEPIVHDLIYHLELAKGCYKTTTKTLARTTMLREENIVKFVCNSSFMRPGYYIAVDHRRKLIILAIRGTQTAYDIVTDIISCGEEEVSFEGYLTHFGTTEAARWFLTHETSTIRCLLQKHEGYKVRLVGHSLGGATVSLLAIMLKKKSRDEIGFNSDVISAVGYATPPCVSKALAENCSDFITTVVLQDDIVPRLSTASLERLRTDILQTDWAKVIEREDLRRVAGLVTNAKQVASSVQDVARKLASFGSSNDRCESEDKKVSGVIGDKEEGDRVAGELWVPGTVYYLNRESGSQSAESFVLLKQPPRDHFQTIVLSGNIISDHKCDTYYCALRDAIKHFPCTNANDYIFG